MIKIVKASTTDVSIIATIGRQSFIETHKTCATEAVLNSYLDKTFTPEIILTELTDNSNHFYIIYYDKKNAGYSKIVFNGKHHNIISNETTKLERLYLLQEFYDYKLGYELFKFNVELSKENKQKGMWLFVWVENERAINFYKKTGFTIVGKHDFEISENHSNPNHQMLLTY
jgi:ribosomal protein S18 acetylase RimI-like enzyme